MSRELVLSEQPVDDGGLTPGAPPVARTNWQLFRRRFLRHKMAVISIAVLVILMVACFGAPWLAPYKQGAQNLLNSDVGPNGKHWFGTDDLGRDQLTEIMYAGRISLLIGIVVALLSTIVGVTIGAVAAYYGSAIDQGLSAIIDLFLILPDLALLAVAILYLGQTFTSIIVVLAALSWMYVARIVRAQVLSLKEKEFVEAARASGASTARILIRHIIPNCTGTIMVNATLSIATAVSAEAALSFLGFGVQPPQNSWGRMLADTESYANSTSRFYLVLFPGLMLVLTVLAVNFLGDALRDAFDPAVEALMADEAVLSVRHLSVEFKTDDGIVHAVDDVSFDLAAGETLGIVGESGSGKSVTSLAILGLLPRTAKIGGEVLFDGENLLERSEKQLTSVRGNRIAMIFQDALTALNPVHRVGDQIAEAMAVHADLYKGEGHRRAVDLLDLVGIPQAGQRVDDYPHEFSGGMRQRAMIAMAIANEPDVLIADEPTTALDVTIQAQVLDVLERIQERTHTATILITHDLGVVAGVADRVLVMYAGRQAELGSVEDIFYRPSHPYTRGLLASLPRLDRRPAGERLHRIKGQPPSLISLPSGCTFHPRCPFADLAGLCTTAVPQPVVVNGPHVSSCHFANTLDQREEHE